MNQNAKNFLLELFFPSFCFGCKKEGFYLCGDCKSTLEISEYNYCLCGKNPLRLPSDSRGKCSRCQDNSLTGLYSALPYKEKALTRALIYHFKYDPYVKDLAKTLAAVVLEHLALAGNLQEEIWKDSILVPMPLFLKREKDRGYNQSEALSEELSKALTVPMITNALVKTKATAEQMKLSAKERQENVKGAFEIKNPTSIAGKKVFLVDDVYTTGSTMQECARVLRAAGAKKVWGIAIAREG